MLAPESARVETVVGRFAHLAHLASYELILSPMFEDVSVFRRGVGEASEVVTKEMYEFEDKGGRRLALRPEGTASVVRAFVQHRPVVPWKAWYATPAFRYETPQAGRYRQHHQLGVEVLGSDDPDLDVEVIALLDTYLRTVGLNGLELRVNSMGDKNCLPAYRELLAAYLVAHSGELCSEHEHTWQKNPLRVLDCKRKECVQLREGAPRLADSLCEDCQAHFSRVLAGLEALGIAYVRDDFLVRGMDYYIRTTFEFASTVLDAAQNAVGGGGRYDGLAAALGGPETPGVGFGSGIERVLLAAEAEGIELDGRSLSTFVVDLTGGAVARDLTYELRTHGISSDRAFDQRSMKAQMRQADRSGARLAVIIGDADLAAGRATLRILAGESAGQQQVVERAYLIPTIMELLG